MKWSGLVLRFESLGIWCILLIVGGFSMEFMNHISPIQPLWEPLSQRGEDKGDGG